MKAFAVINPILEAIKYFYLKANNTCIRQKIDNIIRNREVTAEQAEAIMHPAMVLERFLDENLLAVMRRRAFRRYSVHRRRGQP